MVVYFVVICYMSTIRTKSNKINVNLNAAFKFLTIIAFSKVLCAKKVIVKL